MRRLLWVLLALLVASPAWAQLRPGAFTTVTLTDTTPNALLVGCAVGSTTCTGGIKAGSINVSSITATGNITLNGPTVVSGTFHASGAASFDDTLTVNKTVFTQALSVVGTQATNFNGPITAQGDFPGATAGFFWNQSASGAGFAISGGTGSQYALSVRNSANVEVMRVTAEGVISTPTNVLVGNGLSVTNAVQAGSVATKQLDVVNTVGGAYVGLFRNADPGGNGLLIQAGSGGTVPFQVQNYAGGGLFYILGDGSMALAGKSTFGNDMRVNGTASMAAGGTDGVFTVGGVFSVSNKFTVSNTTGNASLTGNMAVGSLSSAGTIATQGDIVATHSISADYIHITGTGALDADVRVNSPSMTATNMQVNNNLTVNVSATFGGTAQFNGAPSSSGQYRFIGSGPSAQIVNAGGQLTLIWTPTEANVGMFNGGAPTRVTAPAAGFYFVGVSGLSVDAFGGTIVVTFYKNGSPSNCQQHVNNPTVNYLSTSCGFQLGAGEYIEVIVTDNTTSNLFVYTNNARFWAVRIW